MVVGQNITVFLDDESAAERTARIGRPTVTRATTAIWRTEKAIKLFKPRVGWGPGAATIWLFTYGADVHHRCFVLLYKLGEVRQISMNR
jgi:hypothetical protein